MPAATQKELNILREIDKLEREQQKRREKMGKAGLSGLNKKDLAMYDKAEASLKKYNAQLNKLIKAGEKANKEISDLADSIKSVNSAGKAAEDKKLDQFFKKLADQSKAASGALKTITKDLIKLQATGKGGSDLAKGMAGVLKTEKAILEVSQNKASLKAADLDTMKKQAQESLRLLKTDKAASQIAITRNKEQIKAINALDMQQRKQKVINDMQEKQNELVGKFKDIMARVTAGPFPLLILLLEGAKKLMGAVRKHAIDFQQEIGGSADAAYAMVANVGKVHAKTLGVTVLNKKIRDDVMASARAAALAGDNMDLMYNASIAVNDAVIAQQSNIPVSQVAELAQTMSEVTDLSREQASAQLGSAIAFAEQNKVAPAKVMKTMADNAQQLAAMTDGSADSMVRLAVAAAKAGMELSAMESIASSLLDLESSITAEFEASVLLNRDLNLDMARQFALQNNMEGVIGEIQNQLAGQDFGSLDRIQRESLAKAVGMSVADLGSVMARSGKKLEGTMPEKQLKTSKDLLNQNIKMTDLLDTIITVLQWGFMAVVASNALGGLLGGGGLGRLLKKLPRLLAKGGRGAWGAMKASRAGNAFRGVTSRARGFTGSGSNMSSVVSRTTKASSKMTNIAKYSDDALKVSKKVAENSKVQRKVLKTATKLTTKTIPGVNAALMVGELGYNVHQEGLAEGVKKTAKDNKYALAGAGIGAGIGVFGGGIGAAPGAGIGFLVGTGLDILSSFTGGWAKGGTIPRSGIGLVGERGPELVAMSKGSQVIPNHYLGGFADGQFGMVNMKETNALLTQTIGLLSTVAANTQGTADGIKNINLRSGD